MLIVDEVLGGPLCKMQVLWLGVYDAGEDSGRASTLLSPRIAARKLLTARPSTTYGVRRSLVVKYLRTYMDESGGDR